MITFTRPTAEQASQFLRMILAQLGAEADCALEHLGLSHTEFVHLYRTTGEVRAILRGDTLAGYVWIEAREKDVHIHGIALLPEVRNRGIGTAVLHELEREFAGRAAHIELGVQLSNHDAIQLYERLGFRDAEAATAAGFCIMRKAIGLPASPATT